MSRIGHPMNYRRLRAPQAHGERLVDPPLAEVPARLAANSETARQRQRELQGRSLGSLSEAARAHVREAAIDYTRCYRDVPPSLGGSTGPIVMTGHQPELYHAGVWYKNFVLDRIAREQQAVGINLLVDSDTIRQAAIRVPTGTADDPRVELVAFDRPHDEIPYEERPLIDSDLFGSFCERVCENLIGSIKQPLVIGLWPLAMAAARSSQNLGACLSQGRHQLEAAWGLKTLELPMSHVCDGEPFRWFASTILARLTQFQQIHNEALLEYRRINRVRSQAHPVPPLAADGEWIETPFWLWSSADPKRRAVFARQVRGGIEITDRHAEKHCVSISPDGSCEVAVEQLRRLREQGIKLRSRALLTTMFARMFLSDLFIHGIGGAKYDQLTDAIIQRFFGLTAPGFLTVTATAKLPIEYRQVPHSEILAAKLKLRELEFNPQRYLASRPEAASLVEAKQRLIATQSPPDQRRGRNLQFAQLNDAMQPLVEQQRAKLIRERAELIEQTRVDKLLGSREFSFCLFPESTLRTLLLDI